MRSVHFERRSRLQIMTPVDSGALRRSGEAMTPAQAEQLMFARIVATPPELLPLAECWGAALLEEVIADRAQPPCDRVLVDGVALSYAALTGGRRRFRRQGLQAAGEPPIRLASVDDCIEVTTGAVLPDGCDAVVPLEALEVAGEAVAVSAWWSPPSDANVRRTGTEARAGQVLISPGVILKAPEIAAAAAVGRIALTVRRPPRVRSLSVGTELVDVGDPVEPWQVRRATMAALSATLRRHGIPELGSDHVGDDPDRLPGRIASGLEGSDVLVLCGATGRGARDFLAAALGDAGATCLVHGVAQRPGGSMWFGVGPGKQLIFALPGSVAATLSCLARYVIPTLRRMAGRSSPEPKSVVLADGITTGDPTCRFVPVVLSGHAARTAYAATRSLGSPGDMLSLLASDGIVEVAPAGGPVDAGAVVPFYSW